MNDFFHTIYNHALEERILDLRTDPGYLAADRALNELVESLHPDRETQDRFNNAFGAVLYHANVDCLAYGFRLGVRVTAPDRL